jgi:hypothetical protein
MAYLLFYLRLRVTNPADRAPNAVASAAAVWAAIGTLPEATNPAIPVFDGAGAGAGSGVAVATGAGSGVATGAGGATKLTSVALPDAAVAEPVASPLVAVTVAPAAAHVDSTRSDH